MKTKTIHQKRKIRQIIKQNLKFLAGITFGVIISFATVVYAASQNDAWNLGDGWLWFSLGSDSQVHGNVEEPVDDTNIATKAYVDAGTRDYVITSRCNFSWFDPNNSFPDEYCPEGWTVESSTTYSYITGIVYGQEQKLYEDCRETLCYKD